MQTSDLVPRVSDGTATLSPDNLLWKQYEVYVNLFKFYVGVTWKVTTWFATIIGAMLAFQLKSGQPSLRYFLVYPAILSAGLALIFRLARWRRATSGIISITSAINSDCPAARTWTSWSGS